MERIITRLRLVALDIAAIMLAAMFIVFLIQIGARYFNFQTLWTLEACLTLWLWVVFWGGAFVLQEKDHVKFDMVYLAVGKRTRKLFALISALAISGGMLAALPATWSYISFYQIKKSMVIGIRLDVVFSIYAVFAVMVIATYLWRAIRIMRGADPDVLDNRQIHDGYHVQ